MFIGVHDSVIFIGVDEREKFDKIAIEVSDRGPKENGSHVITKTVEQNGLMIVFQHWLVDPPMPTRIAERLKN